MLHSLLIRLEEALIHRIEVETARTVTLMLAAMLEEDREERLELLRLASRVDAATAGVVMLLRPRR